MSDKMENELAAKLAERIQTDWLLARDSDVVDLESIILSVIAPLVAEANEQLKEVNEKWLPAHDEICRRAEQLSDELAESKAENAKLAQEIQELRAALESCEEEMPGECRCNDRPQGTDMPCRYCEAMLNARALLAKQENPQ